MTEHHNVVAEKLAWDIEEKIAGYSNMDRISIYNELLEMIDDKLRQTMQEEYHISDEDWEE